MMRTNDFMKQKDRLIAIIERDQEKLIDALIGYEPYATAKDEIERSLITLKGLEKEFTKIKSSKRLIQSRHFFQSICRCIRSYYSLLHQATLQVPSMCASRTILVLCWANCRKYSI